MNGKTARLVRRLSSAMRVPKRVGYQFWNNIPRNQRGRERRQMAAKLKELK
jgi:hypothetical protein